MIYPYGNLKFPTPYSDTRVDNIIDEDGVIDQFAPISLDIPDDKLIENINQRIEDSKTYYNDTNGFDLEQRRSENLRMYLGVQADTNDFYESEEPYIENQIRGAVDSIVAYATARSPQSVVTPADDTPQAKKFASNLEKAHNLHSVEFDLRGIIEVCVRSWMLNQAAYVMLEFDPNYGEHGEVVPRFVPCDELVVDKNAQFGENPDFIAVYEKHTIEKLVYIFPEKRKEIFDSVNIKRPGPKNITQEVVTKKVWFTYYGDKGKPMEAVAIYYNDVMLGTYQDINWLHGRKNFLKTPMKPIIPLNVVNDGKHWIDFSTPLDDGIRMQKLLNVRGRQISRNAERSNGTTVIDGQGSGLTKEDAENWTGGPNQKIYLKKKQPGAQIDQVIHQIPGHDVKQFVVQDKQDMRNQLFSVMSVPAEQGGADVTSDDPTLGEQLLKKSSAEGRQDMIVRALDRMLYKYFNLLTQMMFVWYDEDHFFSFLDADGSYERIVIKRYYFDDGMSVNVKGSSTIAFDKNREQAMALHFAKNDQLALIDAYRIAGFENPQKLYDNWAKQQKDPFELVRDANDAYDDGDAYAEFLDIINGKEPLFKQDASKDFILTLRKLMLTDKYLKAERKYQKAFNDRLKEYLDMYELRQSLDQLSELDMGRIAPDQPIPEPQPESQPNMGQQMPGGQPVPGMQPGMPGPMMPGQMPPGMPGMIPPSGNPGVMPGPGMGMGGSIFNGTPLMNPANAQTPSGISAIPPI
jgi:hypothetical protein